MIDQRLEALARANEVRFYRAALKCQIAKGEVTLDEVMEMIQDPPAELRTMRIAQILCALPHVGPIKARKALRCAKLNESTTLDGTCAASRHILLQRMSHWRY